MPAVAGDEYRCALCKSVRYIVQRENSAAFQNVKGFVGPEVPVYRDAGTDRYLLGPQGKIAGAGLDENPAGVAKMNEMLAFVGPEHVSR
jgi:hypothetical protein